MVRRTRPGFVENPLGQICRVGSLARASVSHFSHGIVTWPRRQVTKIRLEPSLLLEIRTLISQRQWTQNMWKWICTLWLSADLVVTLFEQVLLLSLEYSTSCNTQVTLDSRPKCLWSLRSRQARNCLECALAEGWHGLTKISSSPFCLMFIGKSCFYKATRRRIRRQSW